MAKETTAPAEETKETAPVKPAANPVEGSGSIKFQSGVVYVPSTVAK